MNYPLQHKRLQEVEADVENAMSRPLGVLSRHPPAQLHERTKWINELALLAISYPPNYTNKLDQRVSISRHIEKVGVDPTFIRNNSSKRTNAYHLAPPTRPTTLIQSNCVYVTSEILCV